MTTAVATTAKAPEERVMKFVPYGSSDEIKLSVSIIQEVVAVPTKTGRTCSKRDALRFMMMCQARRLNPFEGDAFLVGYDGKNGPEFSLITAHQAFLKRAEIHPEFDGMRSGIIILEDEETGKTSDIEGDFHLKDQIVVGGWATVYFKNRKYPISRRIRMDRFNKGFAQWGVDAAGMICKCAEADALRSAFPTMLGGLYMQDEVTLDVKSRTSTSDVADVSKLVEVVTDRAAGQLPQAKAEAQEQQQQTEESAESDAGLAPAQPAAKKATAKDEAAADPNAQLAAIVTNDGYTFSQWQAWAVQSKFFEGADSCGDFGEVPKDIALRAVRARVGMLRAMAEAKGAGK